MNKILFPATTEEDVRDFFEEVCKRIRYKYRNELKESASIASKYDAVGNALISSAAIFWLLCVVSLAILVQVPAALVMPCGIISASCVVLSVVLLILNHYYFTNKGKKVHIIIERCLSDAVNEIRKCDFKITTLDCENLILGENLPPYFTGINPVGVAIHKANELRKYDDFELDFENGLITVFGLINGHRYTSREFYMDAEEFKAFTDKGNEGIYDFSYLDRKFANLKSKSLSSGVPETERFAAGEQGGVIVVDDPRG